jgi:AraC-like DNA-binding protein
MAFAVSKGASRQELAERSRIDQAESQDPDSRISFAKYAALMRAGKELCNDPALALHFGESVDPSEISILPFIASPSETMADALAQLNRFSPLGVDIGDGSDRFQLTPIEGQLWLVDARPNPNDFPEFTESFFARMVCGMRRRFGEMQIVKAIHVTHAEPAYRAEYDRIFQMPVVFESSENALLLSDDAWPTLRNSMPSPSYASVVLAAHAEVLLERLERSKSTRGRVESLLMPIMHTGDASMDMIASKLGLHRQTLFRRLKAEGVTFEKVLDDLRHRLALHYLSEKKASVHETAYLVGFSDPGAFSRAFKRWTGSSPRMMRDSKVENG